MKSGKSFINVVIIQTWFLLFFYVLIGINKMIHAQTLGWANAVGGAAENRGTGICTDLDGNVFISGHFYGSMDLDPGPGSINITSNGYRDIFILKLDGAGNLLWAGTIGGSGGDEVYGSVIDASGNIFFIGHYEGTVDFDPGPGTFNISSNIGSADVFILKLDISSNFLWAKSLGGNFVDRGRDITTDSLGNVLIIGDFQNNGDFDPGPGTYNLTSAGATEIFIEKLDASGNFVWAKAMGGDWYDFGYSITTDASGNIVTTGVFKDTADFDPGIGTFILISQGGYDIFIHKLDVSGNFMWAVVIGGTYDDAGQSITIDPTGNIVSTGNFFGTIDVDPGAGIFNLSTTNFEQSYILKLDESGNFIWAVLIGGGPTAESPGLVCDGSGNIYRTGGFEGPADFDPGPGTYNLQWNGSDDIFIEKLDPAGNFLWAIGMGGTSTDWGSAINLDPWGNVLVTGAFKDTVDFDPNVGTYYLNSEGNYDVFVVKLNTLTDIYDMGNNIKFIIFPNPISDVFSMQFNEEYLPDEHVSIILYNYSGQLQWCISGMKPDRIFTVTGLQEGLYLLKVKAGKDVLVRKLIIH